ncbi:MAG: DJ-1/PfpI family protein [Candidatus Margulisbacteria bacterium]|nr:DJ-1/PfpI family protein [Candidatus Margulisiibacteriota bacterium]MBU1022291.1 DJ-1/PfpI family protein [Candidatus Margulisiibacteriota bacterium]MBU1729904.1 DJ-1/PfpI family protein [Candidatus Margulisiibacteriota bacterium]MBU1955938.1 DJ-1/PfpI family protein [Candidatus Margulisiibacteriota bacterium]
MKKALIIIAKHMFQDKEYADVISVLGQAIVGTTTASSSAGEATGKFGGKTKIDITLDQVKVSDYDVIIFIGGPGADEYFNSPRAHSIAKETVSSGKILAAICIAPTILANAGVLKGKKATVFPTGSQDLTRGGANYTGTHVEIDGKIITADGPNSANAFGQAIVKALK